MLSCPGRRAVVGHPVRRPRRLVAFTTVSAAPAATTDLTVPIPLRPAQTWHTATSGWQLTPGPYRLEAARSCADPRLAITFGAPG